MAPTVNQSSVALWAPKAPPGPSRADPQCRMVGEMAPKANQSSGKPGCVEGAPAVPAVHAAVAVVN